MKDTLCGQEFAYFVPQSFYQVNPVQTERAVRAWPLNAAALTGKETGGGRLLRHRHHWPVRRAAGRSQVVGVELQPGSGPGCRRPTPARQRGQPTRAFICEDATQWLHAAARPRNSGLPKADVDLPGPARGREARRSALRAAAAMRPSRMVYVSCDPATQARDLELLDPPWLDRMERAWPVDLFPHTEHVETVVLLSHKKADSYIHIDVEFGEGEGKIPVDSIAKRAEAYKPKEKVTYKMIKEYIEAKYGFKVHTAYIAEVKRDLGLPMYDAPNAVEELKQPRKHPTPEKVEAIKDALRYFAVI